MSTRRKKPRRGNYAGQGYEVGYRKPPVGHQFQKGQSGNPKGRPRGSRNMAQVLQSIANGKVDIAERGGRLRRMTRIEAMLQNVMTRAVSGDPKHVKLAVELMDRFKVPVIEEPGVKTIEVRYIKPKFSAEQQKSVDEAKRQVAASEERERRRAEEYIKEQAAPSEPVRQRPAVRGRYYPLVGRSRRL